jgi:hypothetical protein
VSVEAVLVLLVVASAIATVFLWAALIVGKRSDRED